MSVVTLRHGNIQDASLLKYWDTLQHVIDSDPDDEWNWDEELTKFPEWREQLMAELNGKPIGFVQIINPAQEETQYWGPMEEGYRAIDIWIGEPDCLGKGYGTQMMLQALDRCFANHEVHTVLIDPLADNHDAIRFYEKLGFEFVEERQFNDSFCKVYQFLRSQWQNHHLN
ncbi:MAG: GNAT family N-acetyltransferase [Bacteroidetes bacterium]|nr:GNAT family N-acetyltransferase [Bacteroidota bacterium]